MTPDGTKAYVTDNGGVSLGNTVSVIDTGTNTVVTTVTVGINPFGIIMNSAGTRVYVANSSYWNGGNTRSVTGSVSVIDTASDTVTATVPTGYVPTLMTFSPDGSALYVTDANSDYVAAISTATNTQTGTFNAGDQPYGLTFAPAGPPPCPPGTSADLRWHYSASGSSGSWSGTQTASCPGSLSMGPQAMEGDLKVTPGTTLQVGYDLTVPGNHSTLTLTVVHPQVTVTVRCVSGATPTAATITVTMPTTTYTITGDAWYPSGDQSSPLVYQGASTVPDLCGGGQIRLDKGGAFTTTLS